MKQKPHEIYVSLGRAAVEAYQEGEASLMVLAHLGAVQTHCFATVMEANAFVEGIECAAGYEDALPVTDLKP